MSNEMEERIEILRTAIARGLCRPIRVHVPSKSKLAKLSSRQRRRKEKDDRRKAKNRTAGEILRDERIQTERIIRRAQELAGPLGECLRKLR